MDSKLLPWKLTTAATLILPPLVFLFFFIIIINKRMKSEAVGVNLPPGPKKLPVIGNLHLLSDPPFRCFREMAKHYGPMMHVKLGEVDAIVISSAEMAKEVLKDKDPTFADRPESIALKIFWYNYISIAFSPYGEYWRQMRKICILELLSARNVRSFASVRKDEVSRMLESLRLCSGEPVNLTEKVFSMTSSVTCRAAFGKVCKDKDSLIKLVKEGLDMGAGFSVADVFPSSLLANALSSVTKLKLMRMRRKMDVILDGIIDEHERSRGTNGEFGNEDLVDVFLRIKKSGDLEFPIAYDNIKAVLFDMFAGGTETSSSTIDWAMTELIRNPQVMAKAQAEVRQAVIGKSNVNTNMIIEDEDIQKLKYLKLIIMETLRLHPQGSIIPRASREACEIDGYTIPPKMKVLVNVWAIHRDSKYWGDSSEDFVPERFLKEPSLDMIGNDFRYLPFGSGKRMCPGMAFGLASVALPLANLILSFNWELPAGINAQNLNMTETSGLATSRKENLLVVATPFQLYL